MSLCSRFCRLETTKILSGTVKVLLLVEVLRRFMGIRRSLNVQEGLNKKRGNDRPFKDETRVYLRLTLSRASESSLHSKTIAGGYETVRQIQKSECASFLKKHASNSCPSATGIAEKFRDIFRSLEEIPSVHVSRTDALRTYATMHGKSLRSRLSQVLTLLVYPLLSVVTFVRRRFVRFATVPQSYLNPSTALCAASQ